ncbi:MAG: retropepsin-like aspartic protease [Anaerolineae bacterium]
MSNRIPVVVVPDTDEPGAAELYVDGTVNGREYRFLLDTGAARSSIAADAFTASLPALGTHHSSGVFSATQDDLVSVEQLQIGPILRQPFQLTRTSGDGNPRSNLVGMDVLKDHSCHFLLDANALEIDPEENFTGVPFQPIRFDRKFHPYVGVRCGQSEAQAVWDSGASLTVVDSAYIQSHPGCFTEVGSSTGTDASGSHVETPMFIMSAVQIGIRRFPPHRVAAVDLSAVNATLEMPMDLIIGYTLYHQANWLFDFPNRRWAVTKIT